VGYLAHWRRLNMNGDTNDLQQAAQDELRRRGMLSRPRLADRIADDQVGFLPPPPDISDDQQITPTTGGMTPPITSQPTRPARPPLKQRILESLPGAAMGAIAAGLTPGDQATQMQQRGIIGQRGLAGQQERAAMERQLQQEAYGQPLQTAQIEREQAGTQAQRLLNKMTQYRLQMMQQGGAGAGLGDLTPDEQALIASAYQTGDPKTIESAVARIAQMRSVSGRMGPSTNVYDPSAPGGVSRQFMTRGGQPGPTVRGAVVPGTLPTTSTSTQLVPTEGGGMAAVNKPETRTPQLPGAPRGGGGMGITQLPITPRLPAQEERAQQTANLALNQLPYVAQELKQLRDQVGPLKGRVMEIGRVIGTTDPTYVKLREDTDLAVSALSVIHFGARGNWQWLQDFRGNVDAGRLTYPDLVAGWQVLERWLRAYSTYGTQRPVDAEVNAPGVPRGQR
jgi:hypothetical protein